MAAEQLTDFEKYFEPGGKFAKLSELEKGFMKLDHLMWRRYKEETQESDAICDHIAETLLMEPELPLLLRARAHIMLSYTVGNDAVGHAQYAFNIMNEDVRELCEKGEARFPQTTFLMAEQALESAIARGPEEAEASDKESDEEHEDSDPVPSWPGAKEVSDQQTAEFMAELERLKKTEAHGLDDQQAAQASVEMEKLKLTGADAIDPDAMDISEPELPSMTAHSSQAEETKVTLKSTLKHALASIVPGGSLPISQHGLVTPAASRQVSSLEDMVKTPAGSQGEGSKDPVPPTPPGTGQGLLKRFSSRRLKNEFGTIVEKPKEE